MDQQQPSWQDIFGKGPRPSRPSRPVKQVRHGELKAALITLLFALVLFYFSLPAINLHAEEFYSYIAMVLFFYTLVRIPLVVRSRWHRVEEQGSVKGKLKTTMPLLFPLYILAALIVIAGVGSLLGAPILRASDYSSLIAVQEGEFTQDVGAVTYDQIPLLDKASAEKLGDRKLGTLADMVSQFEVANNYTQINYHGRPVRVTPLLYGDLFKWFNNRSEGLPAYLLIDMITQEVEVVRLSSMGESGIKYSSSEPFFRNVYRTLRFQYPTYLFGQVDFEVDESGTPYWVASRIVKRIGLFGGDDVAGAVLLNAITGESTYYPVEEVPTWVDNVYNADLIIDQYDYYGKYSNGFWNATFGQRNVVMTTDGYNYIAINDDVYMYTGVTSVGRDESNVGFILCNQRTKEVRYYQNGGAIETSAMESAQDAVQNFGYAATFPILLDIEGQPSYFMSLYGDSNTVKGYALVSLEDKTVVGTGLIDTNSDAKALNTAVENYINAMKDKGWIAKTVNAADYVKDEAEIATAGGEQTGGAAKPSAKPSAPADSKTVTGKITDIKSSVNDGNTVYYLQVDGVYYYIRVTDCMQVLLLQKGDTVEITPQGDAKDGFAQAAAVKAK